jgi:hypothetical protein
MLSGSGASRDSTPAALTTERKNVRQPSQNLAQEQLGPLVLRMVEERLGLIHLDDLAGVHQDHPVCDLTGKCHLVAHHQHGHAVGREADHSMISSLGPTPAHLDPHMVVDNWGLGLAG